MSALQRAGLKSRERQKEEEGLSDGMEGMPSLTRALFKIGAE